MFLRTFKEKLMSLFKKLRDLVRRNRNKAYEDLVDELVDDGFFSEEPNKEEVAPKKETVKKEEPKSGNDPVKSNPNGQVTTFLWKPEADHSPLPVVVVGCDEIRAADLNMEILGKSGKALKIEIRNTGRANKLGHMKYARVHFRPQRSVEQLQRSAPIAVRFYHTFTGKKVYVKVRGKDRIRINNTDRRKDLK
jgi:hypothetical protein